MTTTAIRNKSNTILVLNIPPAVMPKRAIYTRTVSHRDGTQEQSSVRVVHGSSFHILAGETRRGFSNAVRRCPDVVNALRAGKIQLIEEADAKPAPASAPAVETPTSVEPEVVVEIDATPGDEEDGTREAPAPETSTTRGVGRKSKNG